MPFEKPDGKILLYHGTVREHGKGYAIDLNGRRSDMDFGRGYYLTSVPFQAEDWAKRKGRPGAEGWVYEYALQIPAGFPVLVLPEYNRQWLNLITYHRLRNFGPFLEGAVPDSAIIIGGMADRARLAQLLKILENYSCGKCAASDALAQITPKKALDQYCFKTPEAIGLLQQTRVWKWTCTQNWDRNRWKWAGG